MCTCEKPVVWIAAVIALAAHGIGGTELGAIHLWAIRKWLAPCRPLARRCIWRGSLFGSDAWTHRTAKSWGLESTLRARGRPKIKPDN